jgi:hypothetical protein
MVHAPERTRVVRLLVEVAGLSGRRYPIGTEVHVRGTGSSVDGHIGGDWLPLAWWEYSEGLEEPEVAKKG